MAGLREGKIENRKSKMEFRAEDVGETIAGVQRGKEKLLTRDE
jgi:hypothetical protein